MRLLLLAFIPYWAFALITEERMPTQILKVYDQNVLVLNRGLEDGIEKNSHIKLTSDDGFIARGICIKAGMISSHWKIYRVVRPELVSKDTIYNLNSMNQSEIPEDIKEQYGKVNFDKKYRDWDEKKADRYLKQQQKRFAKYDFPSSTGGENIYPEQSENWTERMMARNFNKKKFVRDMSNMNFTIFASPYSTSTLGDQQNADYGVSVHNKGDKYDLVGNYTSSFQRLTDPIEKESVTIARNVLNAELVIKDFTNSWDYVTYAQYDNAKFGEVNTPRHHVKLAPFGMKYNWGDDKADDFTDFTYMLFFDQRTDDKLEPVLRFDSSRGGYVLDKYDVEQKTSDRIRHGLRLRTRGKFSKTIAYSNEFWYQPAMSMTDWKLDFDDVDMFNIFRLSFLLGDHMYLDIENHYRHDILQKENYFIEPSVSSNVIHFRYNFDL